MHSSDAAKVFHAFGIACVAPFEQPGSVYACMYTEVHVQLLKMFVKRDSGLTLPKHSSARRSAGPHGGLQARRQAVGEWLDAALTNAAQGVRTLRLLALVLGGRKRAALRFIRRRGLARRVGGAVQSGTLLSTLRRAALVARALGRGVSSRRESQLSWKVPVGVKVASGGSRSVEAHCAVSILLCVMLARCAFCALQTARIDCLLLILFLSNSFVAQPSDATCAKPRLACILLVWRAQGRLCEHHWVSICPIFQYVASDTVVYTRSPRDVDTALLWTGGRRSRRSER